MIGTYKLLCESDSDGVYSSGDSLDILETFETLNELVKDSFLSREVKMIFQESVDKHMLVTAS